MRNVGYDTLSNHVDTLLSTVASMLLVTRGDINTCVAASGSLSKAFTESLRYDGSKLGNQDSFSHFHT